MIWTGDELGYMQKWDVSSLLSKLIEKEEQIIQTAKDQAELLEKTKATGKNQGQQKSVFITGTNQNVHEENPMAQSM